MRREAVGVERLLVVDETGVRQMAGRYLREAGTSRWGDRWSPGPAIFTRGLGSECGTWAPLRFPGSGLEVPRGLS
jgi:hypothetical protein